MTVEKYGRDNYNDVITAQKTWFGTTWETWVIHGLGGDDILTGGADNDYLYGEAGNDTLVGNGDNDVLDGGAGIDTMRGGTGDDTYVVDNASDQVVEWINEGYDLVKSSAYSYTLSNNVENLLLIDQAYEGSGNSGGNNISGSNADNRLQGWGGNDLIYGYGGKDRIFGGEGADSLNGGDGDDYIRAYSDTASSYGDGNYQDTLNGGTGNDSLFAGEGADLLIGEADNDFLASGKDSQADILVGGYGSDTYFIQGAAAIREDADGGIDMVYTELDNYSLPEPVSYLNVENLTLGANVINGSGNSLSNTLWGNANNNRLDGKAKGDVLFGYDGADTLIGGDGNDFMDGGNNDDVLNGYNSALSGVDDIEIDYLTGGGGADRFLLGGDYSYYSVGANSDFAVILDYNRAAGDKLEVFGVRSLHAQNYQLVQNANLYNGSAADTQIFYKNELIAVVADNSTMTIGQDLVFAGNPANF